MNGARTLEPAKATFLGLHGRDRLLQSAVLSTGHVRSTPAARLTFERFARRIWNFRIAETL
jgi:hypothetical protein